MTSFVLQMTSHPLYHTKPEYLRCHIHFGHGNTSPVSDITLTVTLSSHVLHWHLTHFCMTSYPPSVWHHMNYIQLHTQSLCHHTTVPMTSQTLYMKPHPVWGQHIHVTSQPLSGSSHPLYRQHHTQSLYDITLTIYVASCALYKTSHPHFLTSNHHFEDITPTILDIMSIVSVSSHQHYRWYHSHYIYDIASSIGETFCPLYLWHHTHYVWHHNPVCWLHQTRHMYDIIWATEDVTSTLSY